MSKLEVIWKRKNVLFKTKLELYTSVVLSTLLYSCESLTLTRELEKSIEAFEYKNQQKIVGDFIC